MNDIWTFKGTFLQFCALWGSIFLVWILSIPDGTITMHKIRTGLNMCEVNIKAPSHSFPFVTESPWPYPYDVCLPQHNQYVVEVTRRMREYVDVVEDKYVKNRAPILFATMFGVNLRIVMFPTLNNLVLINPEKIVNVDVDEPETSSRPTERFFDTVVEGVMDYFTSKRITVDQDRVIPCHIEYPVIIPPLSKYNGIPRKRKVGPFDFESPSRIRVYYIDESGAENIQIFENEGACYIEFALRSHDLLYQYTPT